MAGTKFRRALSWGAGIGLLASNRLVRNRSQGTTKDTQIRVPDPVVGDDLKGEVYRVRGETVSVGGMVEWLIATLASRFAVSTKKNTRGQWKDLKRHLKSKGLKKDLEDELGKVGRYFKPRNLAAHAGIIITGVGEATQIFRLTKNGKGKSQVELVTVGELREDAATAKAGYDAIQAIGRALDDNDPTVLADMDALAKGMLLGKI